MTSSPSVTPAQLSQAAVLWWWVGLGGSAWAVVFVPLALFMTVAFVPGLIVTAVWTVLLAMAVTRTYRDEQQDLDDVSSYEQLPYSWGAFAGAIGGAAVASAGILGADLAVRDAFYEQVSQVIPVLLLTFAVEQRFFTRLSQRNTRVDAGIAFVFVMVTAVLAELLVLTSLAGTTSWLQSAATVAIAAAVPASLVLIAMSAFVNAFRLLEEPARENEPVAV